jgi:UDP-GlcNAc:undecaprenyl-phosphate GlcNAc-1-phosphate transferase
MTLFERLHEIFRGQQGEIGYALYALIFVCALLLTYGLTLVLIRLAPRLGAVAQLSARHIHQRPVPKLGGLAIFLAVALALALAALCSPVVARDLMSAKSLAIFVGMLVMLCLGIYDDLRHASWLPKFAFQIVAACIVIHEDLVISKITNPFGPTLELPMIFALLFTIVWLVGITNAVNLSDGLDGLATGIVLIVCGVTFANSLQLMQTRPEQYDFFVFSAVTSVAVLGAALAFLRFNFYPARIFLGDTGSLFLGFLIACTAVRSAQISTTTVALVVPVIALGLPILDTVLAFLRRTARRRNPFQADLEHIHHKMMESGLSHPETVLVLYGFCLLLGVAALVLALKKNQYAGIVLFVLTIITLAGFKKFGVLDVTRLWGMRGRNDDRPRDQARPPRAPRKK